jgi:hypothetical protein
MNDGKVDEFVAMVERAKKIYGEGKDKDTPNHKRKQGEEDMDYSSTLGLDLQCVDAMMSVARLQSRQRRETRAFRCLELEHTNLNVVVVHKIGETSSDSIMDLSHGSNSK